MMPSEKIMQQINSMRITGIRPPGDTGYVYNLQQANALVEGGIFYIKKVFFKLGVSVNLVDTELLPCNVQ